MVTVLRLFDALGIVRLDAGLVAWHPWSTEPNLGDGGGQVDHSSDVHIGRGANCRDGAKAGRALNRRRSA
jgi:hypothetical protein